MNGAVFHTSATMIAKRAGQGSAVHRMSVPSILLAMPSLAKMKNHSLAVTAVGMAHGTRTDARSRPRPRNDLAITSAIAKPITVSIDTDAPATAALRLKSSSVTGDYAALRPYLRATVAIDGGAPTAVPAAAFTPGGLAHTVALPGTLRPGQNRTVSLRVFVPMTDAAGTDIPQILRATRSTSAATPATAFTMTNTLELVQVPENR